ncbi:MAG: metal-dependent transcriptional regulator [Candidatus Pacearchaeota archaeon]
MAEKAVKRGKEDYLQAIYQIYENGSGEGVRSIEIAKKFGVSKASVSEMLRKLANEGLVKLKPYSKIFLTFKGRKIAKEFSNKQDIIERFLKKYFGHNDNIIEEEARRLKQAFSDKSLNKLYEFVEGKKDFNMPGYVG